MGLTRATIRSPEAEPREVWVCANGEACEDRRRTQARLQQELEAEASQ